MVRSLARLKGKLWEGSRLCSHHSNANEVYFVCIVLSIVFFLIAVGISVTYPFISSFMLRLFYALQVTANVVLFV